ncbi:MAG: alkaline phosphatase family protein, partial [Actinomycetota bacterium]|nr:alkaline phosphatase family protein [Actinomycetota bacterium]
PYINKLYKKNPHATSIYAESHPSLPNYIAMTSGSTQGITDDLPPASHRLGGPSLFGQMRKGWRSLEESMPSRCDLTSSGKYAVKHNPAAYYTKIRKRCRKRDVRLTNPPNISARFTFVTPNLCNDMHSCATSVGDTWLSNWLPKVLKTRKYRSGSTAIFLTWDEGSGSQPIATLVISPYTPPGTVSSVRLNHYSMLRTTEAMLGRKRFLGQAATARGMRRAFHL